MGGGGGLGDSVVSKIYCKDGVVNFSYGTTTPPTHLLPHLYTTLNSSQGSKLKSQNLLEINRKL